jgi:hypothetical protein
VDELCRPEDDDVVLEPVDVEPLEAVDPVVPLVVAGVPAVDFEECPEYDEAARKENAPVRPAQPARVQRVSFETRFIPSFRARMRCDDMRTVSGRQLGRGPAIPRNSL